MDIGGGLTAMQIQTEEMRRAMGEADGTVEIRKAGATVRRVP